MCGTSTNVDKPSEKDKQANIEMHNLLRWRKWSQDKQRNDHFEAKCHPLKHYFLIKFPNCSAGEVITVNTHFGTRYAVYVLPQRFSHNVLN